MNFRLIIALYAELLRESGVGNNSNGKRAGKPGDVFASWDRGEIMGKLLPGFQS